LGWNKKCDLLGNCEKDTDILQFESGSEYRKTTEKAEKSIFYSSKATQNIEKLPKRQKSRYFIVQKPLKISKNRWKSRKVDIL